MKKIIRNKEFQKATRKFTDREQPRKVFWDEYHRLEQNLKTDDDIHVISYYGVGGIGKSTLLRKITKELDEEKAIYALFDFETAQDAKTVLTLIKNQLEQKASFQFPIFDLALYTYARKIGESLDKPEVKSLVEKSKTLSFLVDVLNEIPLIGMASTVFKLADSGLAILKNKNTKYKADLIRLENETPEETYKRLPYYFSQDLNANLEKIDKPLVILLDTYEKLVNEVKAEGYSLMQDAWLRSDDGPILQVPGVLWILAGREKIKWGEYDKDWEETLNQHILGDLSFKDANDFLQEAGIEEENLRKEIYELTNGTPVYLDICVSTYEILKENNEEITIDKFGKNVDVLVERFIRYMDAQSSEIAYVLSQIGNWTDEMIQEVGYEILPNFSITLYEKIKGLSFIFCENEKYYMHKTVRDILKKECPEIIQEKTMTEIECYYRIYIVEKSILDKDYITNIDNYFNTAMTNLVRNKDDETISNMSYVIGELLGKFLVDKVDQIINNIYPILKRNYPDTESMYTLDLDYSNMLIRQGKIFDGITLYEKVLREMMDKKIFNIMRFQNIALNMSHYKDVTNKKLTSDFLNYLKQYDLKSVKRYDDPEFMAVFYNIESQLYIVLSRYEDALDALMKAYEASDIKDNNVTLGIMSMALYLISKNKIFHKSTEYIEICEKILSEDSTINHNYFESILVLINWYGNTIGNMEKTLYWVNKAEEYYHKMYGDAHVFNDEWKIIRWKLSVLDAINNPDLKSYAKTMKKMVEENYDTQNIEVEILLMRILKYIDLKERKEFIEKLYQKYTQGKVNVACMYEIADELSSTDESDFTKRFVDTISDAIEKEGLNENNIDIYQKALDLISDADIKKNIDSIVPKINKCIKYYQDKYGDDSDMVLEAMNRKVGFYNCVTEYDKAIEVCEKQYEICKKKYGEDSIECARINNIIGALYDKTENEKTTTYFQKALTIFKKILGENNSETIRTEYSLIASLPYNEDTLKKLQQYYEKIVSIVGENDKLAYNVLNDIGLISMVVNHYEEALQIHFKLYDINKKEYGDTAYTTIEQIKNIAEIYYDLEDYPNALTYYQKLYQIYLEKYGENDDLAVEQLQKVASIYKYLKEYDKELEAREKLYQNLIQKYPEDDEKVLEVYHKIAIAYRNIKNYAKALEMHSYLYEMYVKKYGEEDDKTLEILEWTSTEYFYLEQPEKAQELNEKLYQTYLKKYGEKHRLTARNLINQTSVLSFLGKDKKALEIGLRLVGIYQELGKTNEQEKVIKLVVSCYEKEEKYEEALEFLEKWSPHMENKTRGLIEKAHVYYQMGNIEETKKIVENISLKEIEKESCNNVYDVRYLNDLVDVLIACKKEKEAKVVMKKIMTIIDNIWPKYDVYKKVMDNIKKLNMNKF